MTNKEEAAYVQGENAVYRRLLAECLKHLPGPEASKESWRLERLDLIAALRSLCDDLDWPNDWDDATYLADVVNKFPR